MTQTAHISATITAQTKPATLKNAVCFAVDQRYMPFAIFVANQILEKEQNIDFDIVICLPDLKIVPSVWLNSPIRFCALQTQGVDDFPVDHLSLAAYYRLFLPHAFQHEYENIIYLDADTYLTRAFLSDFFKKIPADLVIAAAPDVANIYLDCDLEITRPRKRHLKEYFSRYYAVQHTYRNSGVLIIKTRNYIQKNCLERTLLIATANLKNMPYHDQTALNMALHSDLSMLAFTYNWQADERINHLFSRFNPALIHFIGTSKPWNTKYGFYGLYHAEYNHFLTKYFPNLNINVQTQKKDAAYRHRLENPKYKNTLREGFSREVGAFRRPISRFFKRIANYIFKTNSIKNHIEQQLKQSLVPSQTEQTLY